MSQRSTLGQGHPHPLLPGNPLLFGAPRSRPSKYGRGRSQQFPASPSLNLHTEGILHLVLPLPPSINHQYATVQGRRVLSSSGRRFKSRVGQEVLFALAGRRPRERRPFLETLHGLPLVLDLRFYFESGLRRDIDGGLKITQDAVCEALGINDNRIIEVTLRKETDATAPRMELSLRAAHPHASPRAST